MTIRVPIRTAAVLAATALSVASANAGLAAPRISSSNAAATPVTYQVLRQDVIINADIWAAKPEMMAAWRDSPASSACRTSAPAT